MDSKRIVIVGGRGVMGCMFEREFSRLGHDVVCVDHKTEITPSDAVKSADVVIVTVPIRKTEAVIREIGPFIPEHALFTDFTSIKTFPTEAMTESSRAEVVGGHPLFGPMENVKGQKFVLCPAREGPLVEWFASTLKSLGLEVVIMTAEEHDRMMAVIQGMTAFCGVAFGVSVKNSGVSVDRLEYFATPTARLRLLSVARMVSLSSEMYADMLLLNPFAREFLQRQAEFSRVLADALASGDDALFIERFEELKSFFVPFVADANRAVEKLLVKRIS